MVIWQLAAIVLLIFLVIVGVLAIIEPGPLTRRSRNPRFRDPNPPDKPQK